MKGSLYVTGNPDADELLSSDPLALLLGMLLDLVFEPGQFDTITAPTLLLAGSETPADLTKATHHAADAIPNAQIRMLEGHGHFAHKTDPAMVSAVIRQFIWS